MKMKFTEMGNPEGKTLMLLPGTACTWEINFHTVIDLLKERYGRKDADAAAGNGMHVGD